MFSFSITAQDTKTRARTGAFETPHGVLKTPAYAVVATDGEVKSLQPNHIPPTSTQYMISNTFHIFTKGILEKIEKVGGIHTYTNAQDKVIATDSGGFQIFSLGFGKSHGVGKIAGMFPEETDLEKNGRVLNPPLQSTDYQLPTDSNNPLTITDDGVSFTFDNRTITLTPEISMNIQHRIGADIIFAFDECTSPLNSERYTEEALERTHAWIKRCIDYHNNPNYRRDQATPKEPQRSLNPTHHSLPTTHYQEVTSQNPTHSSYHLPPTTYQPMQALFGIIQGGAYEDLRKRSTRYFAQLDVPGYGIGGSLGKSKQEMHQILNWIIPLLPDHKPRHLLGIGHVRDVFECVEQGIDLFDCVIPTREARHKVLYTKQGKFPMRKLKTRDERLFFDYTTFNLNKPVTFVDLYALFLAKDPRAYTYATLHNIEFFGTMMKEIRDSIQNGGYEKVKESYLKYY